MKAKPPRYHTFLLTMWEERSQDPTTPSAWRYRLEDPHTGQKQGFIKLKNLLAVLEEKLKGKAKGGSQ